MGGAAARQQVSGAIDGAAPAGATPEITHGGYVPAFDTPSTAE